MWIVAYVTLQQLKDRVGTSLYSRLTDRVNGTIANDTVGQQVVNEAEAEANSRLAVRYATPVDLAANPELADVLAARVLDLAESIAWSGSPFMGDVPDRVRSLRSAAFEWFDAVAAGRIHLPAATLPRSTTAVDDTAKVSATERKFTAAELEGL
jgi:phage gp36-like protein